MQHESFLVHGDMACCSVVVGGSFDKVFVKWSAESEVKGECKCREICKYGIGPRVRPVVQGKAAPPVTKPASPGA